MVMKKIRERLNSIKGASMIEFTMVMLIFMMLFSFGYELTVVGYKYLTVSDYANDVVRTLAVQGGIDRQAPSGFQGGDRAYKDLSEMANEKKKFAKMVGVEPRDLRILVSRETLTGTVVSNIEDGRQIKIDYLEPFEVKVEYVPSLEMMGDYGFKLNGVLNRVKVGISEYVYDYEA